MSTPIWPTSLPQKPQQGGFQISVANNVIRTTTDTRNVKTRRRFTSAPTGYTMSFIFNDTQLDTFLTFFENALAYGSLDFEFPDPIDGSVTYRFAFAAQPTINSVGGDVYSVQMRLQRKTIAL